jgi:hypothetical protein
MPEATPFELRIYCLCGQKMKVTSDMLGKPGKCIACRQKIRIPAEDELDHDETVIHLKDHPEYLRKPARAAKEAPAFSDESVSDLERDDVMLEGESGQLNAVAFERFEPIRRLCNYEHKVRAEIQCLREGRSSELDKATLMGYRGLARQTRHQLEDAIREELITIATELNEIRDVLAAQQKALHEGNTEYVAFSKVVLPVRKRREVLVYRQQNLRGWLATEDPHVAGGLDDVPLVDVPVDLAEEPFPLDDDIEGLPIENAVIRLEQALRERETADKLLNELHRMNLDGIITVDELARRRADTEAERQRARMAVAFYRGRLEQVIQDCEEDSSALNNYETAMKKELTAAEVGPQAFKKLEETIFKAQVDVKRARNMANRALNANAVSDVPNPHGTFLQRLARPGGLGSLGLDTWLAWAAGIMLLITVFVPVATRVPGGVPSAFQGTSMLVLIFAALLGLSATVMLRPFRGTLLNGLWLIFTVAGAFYVRETYGSDAGSSALGSTGVWWASPSGVMGLVAWALLGLGALLSLWPLGLARWFASANLVLGIALAIVIISNFFGIFQPRPELGEPVATLDTATGTYSVRIAVDNVGGAPFHVGSAEGAFAYVLESKIGSNSWTDAGSPLGLEIAGAATEFDTSADLVVPGGQQVKFIHELGPGIYRVQLIPGTPGEMDLRRTFELAPLDPNAIRPGGDGNMSEPAPVPKPQGIEVELRGALDGPDSTPIFSMILRKPDGSESKAQFRLGDTVYGEWTISEFSPAHNTVTVVNGDRLIVIERGTAETLD